MEYQRQVSSSPLTKKLTTSYGIYDGVFTSSPVKVIRNPVENYGEIFGGSGVVSSIPILDLLDLNEADVSIDVRTSSVDYSKIFGGCEESAISYEELFAKAERTPAKARPLGEKSDPSKLSGDTNFSFNKTSFQSFNGVKKFNLSYQKTNQGTMEGKNGTTHIAQLHAVPGYACLINEGGNLRNSETNAGHYDAKSSEEKMGGSVSKKVASGGMAKKTLTSGNSDESESNGSLFDEFKTSFGHASHCMSENNVDSLSSTASKTKQSETDIPDGASRCCSPPYFDDEVDENSVAAASAAAVRKAIEEAQARIKTAKELMQRKKSTLQNRTKPSFDDSKTEKPYSRAKKLTQRMAHDNARTNQPILSFTGRGKPIVSPDGVMEIEELESAQVGNRQEVREVKAARQISSLVITGLSEATTLKLQQTQTENDKTQLHKNLKRKEEQTFTEASQISEECGSAPLPKESRDFDEIVANINAEMKKCVKKLSSSHDELVENKEKLRNAQKQQKDKKLFVETSKKLEEYDAKPSEIVAERKENKEKINPELKRHAKKLISGEEVLCVEENKEKEQNAQKLPKDIKVAMVTFAGSDKWDSTPSSKEAYNAYETTAEINSGLKKPAKKLNSSQDIHGLAENNEKLQNSQDQQNREAFTETFKMSEGYGSIQPMEDYDLGEVVVEMNSELKKHARKSNSSQECLAEHIEKLQNVKEKRIELFTETSGVSEECDSLPSFKGDLNLDGNDNFESVKCVKKLNSSKKVCGLVEGTQNLQNVQDQQKEKITFRETSDMPGGCDLVPSPKDAHNLVEIVAKNNSGLKKCGKELKSWKELHSLVENTEKPGNAQEQQKEKKTLMERQNMMSCPDGNKELEKETRLSIEDEGIRVAALELEEKEKAGNDSCWDTKVKLDQVCEQNLNGASNPRSIGDRHEIKEESIPELAEENRELLEEVSLVNPNEQRRDPTRVWLEADGTKSGIGQSIVCNIENARLRRAREYHGNEEDGEDAKIFVEKRSFETNDKVQHTCQPSEIEKTVNGASDALDFSKNDTHDRNFVQKHNLKENEPVFSLDEQNGVPCSQSGENEKMSSNGTNGQESRLPCILERKQRDEEISDVLQTTQITQSVKENHRTSQTIKIMQSVEENHRTSQTADEREAENKFYRDAELEKIHKRIKEEKKNERIAVERAIREARERAFVEARERAALERATTEALKRTMSDSQEKFERSSADANGKSSADKAAMEVKLKTERAAVERATTEALKRAMADSREKFERSSADANGKSSADKAAMEVKLKNERTAVERATAEARDRALEKAVKARSYSEKTSPDNVSGGSKNSGTKQSYSFNDPSSRVPASSSSSGFPSSSNHGESAHWSKAGQERHQRTVERAEKALAEKNMRDCLAQKELAERNRLAEALDAEVKRWSGGKEGKLRPLLSTLQYILGPDSGWQPIYLTDMITISAVKKAYKKATLIVHPDKLQQRGASIQQKYTCEKVFDLLKEAYNKISAEER